MVTPRRIEAHGGFTAAVTSVCQPNQGVTIIAVVFLIRGPVFGDRIDLGVTLDMAEHRVADGGLAELACHGDVLCVVEILVAKEHDLPTFRKASRTAFNCSGGSGRARSTPWISAPICRVKRTLR